MPARKMPIKPTKQANKDLKDFVRRVKAWQAKFVSEERRFSDSAEEIRSDRDSRIELFRS